MHVLCKKCGRPIAVANKPSGTTSISGVQARGNTNIAGGGISFGPGGSIAFGPNGRIGFGTPVASTFKCMGCGESNDYHPEEFKD